MHEAVSWCERAVYLQPTRQAYLGQLALVLLWLKQPNQALPWAQRAVETVPEWALGHRILGDIYIALGDILQAEAAYQTALAINPKDRVAKHRLDNLKRVKSQTRR